MSGPRTSQSTKGRSPGEQRRKMRGALCPRCRAVPTLRTTHPRAVANDESVARPARLRRRFDRENGARHGPDLEDPRVRVEAEFPREAFLDLGLRSRLFAEAPAEHSVRWPRVVEDALRRRTEQLGGAVEPIELDENSPGLL